MARIDPQLGGRNSLTLGVICNWASQAVFVLSGFLLPRIIDRRLGQEMLGVWDFAWALTAHTGLLAMGLSSAMSRYVARFRRLGDHEGMNRAYSATLFLLGAGFALACGLVAAFIALTPRLIHVESGQQDVRALIGDARILVAILGASAAIQLPLSVYSGVLSGYQRFDLRTGIRVVCSLVALCMMIAALLLGRGLAWVAAIYLVSECMMGVLNRAAAMRLCPQLGFVPSAVTAASMKEVVSLGGKTALQSLSRMSLYQTSGLIVSALVGSAALAIYSRQRALTQFVYKLMSQYGNVFTPEASALQAQTDVQGLQSLVVKAGRFGFAISLPFVVIFSLAGGTILELWMGQRYEAPKVLAILMVGHVLTFAHRGTFNVLIGLDRHGAAALWEMGSAIGSIGLGLLFVGVLKWGLSGAALAVAIAVAAGGGFAPAWLACRAVGLSFGIYFVRVLPLPLLCVTPLAIAFTVASIAFPDRAFIQLGVGLGIGGMLTVPLYWRIILTHSLRGRFRAGARRCAARVGLRSGAVRTGS